MQRNSIDEGYLDLGPCGFRTAEEIERRIRALQQRIWDELQITASFGVAANKLVSAIASKARKPRGFTVVPPGTEAAFLAPLKISVIPGVGKKSEERLAAAGIKVVSDVFTRNERELKALFGSDWQEMLRMARHGEDDRPVHVDHEDAKSYSVQETFNENIADFAEIERIAKRMIDELMPAIRADGKRVKTMTVKVRYPGMEDSSTGRSLAEATDLEGAVLSAGGAAAEGGVDAEASVAARQREVFECGGEGRPARNVRPDRREETPARRGAGQAQPAGKEGRGPPRTSAGRGGNSNET